MIVEAFSGKNPVTLLTYEHGRNTWYTQVGGTMVFCIPTEQLVEGVDIETLDDLDQFSYVPINTLEELEEAVNN
jgi:hypothetical protein